MYILVYDLIALAPLFNLSCRVQKPKI